jgi:hypothetical protein
MSFDRVGRPQHDQFERAGVDRDETLSRGGVFRVRDDEPARRVGARLQDVTTWPFYAARWLLSQQRRRLWPAVLLSPGRSAELLAVLTRDHGGRLQPNADGTALVYEGTLCGDPPDDVLRCQYRRHRHHLVWTLFGVVGLLLTR